MAARVIRDLYLLKHEPPDDAQLNAFLHTWELEGDVTPFNDQFLKHRGLNLKQELYLILEPRSIPKRIGIHAQVLLQWNEHPPDKATWEAFQLQTLTNLSSSFSFVFRSCFPQSNNSPFQPQQVVAVVVSGLIRSTWRVTECSLSTGVMSESVQNAQAEDRQPECGYKEEQGEIHEQPKIMSNSTNVGRSTELEYKGRMGAFNPVLAMEFQFPTAFILSKVPISEKKKTEVSFVEDVRDEIATTQVLTNRIVHFKANDEVMSQSGSSNYSCENFDSDVDPYFNLSGDVAELKVQVSVQANDSFVNGFFHKESIYIHEPTNSGGVLNLVVVNEVAVRLAVKMVMLQWKDHPPDAATLATYGTRGFSDFIREVTNYVEEEAMQWYIGYLGLTVEVPSGTNSKWKSEEKEKSSVGLSTFWAKHQKSKGPNTHS